jgi:hypothetical protein
LTLITDEDRKALLQNGRAAAQSDSFDPIPVVKIFAPDGRSTWLLSELDPSDPDLAFGLADLGQGAPELGNFMLSEIAEVSGTAGLPPERDRFFRATAPLSVYAAAARAAGAIINPRAV